MLQYIIQVSIFFLASASSVGLITISRNLQISQQLIPLLLVLDIFIAGRINPQNNSPANYPKLAIIFISAFLVQVIVTTSGGLYSPLLILLHLFALGAIFLLGNSSAIFFLVFSLGVLLFHLSYDKNLNQFFQSDPWTVVIYVLSLIIVMPLVLYLARSSKAKDKFNSFLKDYITTSENKQKSILTALSNMVIITDKNLKILSLNIAAERFFRTTLAQVEGKEIFEILKLKDSLDNDVPVESLPIKQALLDSSTHFVEGYNIQTQTQAKIKPVMLQIKSITNTRGEINQVLFILTDPMVKIGFNTHPTIKEAIKKRDLILERLTGTDSPLSEEVLMRSILLITHIEEDVLTVQEMEDHPLQEVIGFSDLVEMANQIVGRKKLLYSNIGVLPEVSFDDEANSEAAYLNLRNSSFEGLNFSKYSAPIDSFLVKLILEKLIDLCVFFTGKEGQKIQVNFSLDLDGNIKLTIAVPTFGLKDRDLPNLFIKDYPGLNIPGLKLSSGLEGYIAGRIAKTIQLNIKTTVNIYKKVILTEIIIPKQAKITES